MLNITDYFTKITELAESIPAIKHLVFVTSDNQATTRLKDKSGICLVAVIPSFDVSGQLARSVDDASTYFFVVRKAKPDDKKDQEQSLYQETQDVLYALKDSISNKAEEGCSVFWRLSPESIHIDPEYNTFGGFSGWSMSMSF